MSKVSGGEVSTFKDGTENYTAHTFHENGTFITNVPLIVNFLVIGGGGGGGGGTTSTSYPGGGGGGGAGGFREIQSFTVLPGEYSVIVGTGGSGGGADTYGSDGTQSKVFGISAAGGGGGAHRLRNSTNYTGNSGGSGGGGARAGNGGTGNTPATDPPQGNDGFRSLSDPAGGGGGGAGEGSATTARARGGDGKISTITGSEIYYAGGGGGGGVDSGTYYGGGLGGGGNGSGLSGGFDSTSGTDGTGGGGGGGVTSEISSIRSGSRGGSGIVIVRYSLITSRGKIFLSGNTPARRKIVTVSRPTDGSAPIVLDYTFSDEETGEFELIRLPGVTSRIIFDENIDRIDKVRLDV